MGKTNILKLERVNNGNTRKRSKIWQNQNDINDIVSVSSLSPLENMLHSLPAFLRCKFCSKLTTKTRQLQQFWCYEQFFHVGVFCTFYVLPNLRPVSRGTYVTTCLNNPSPTPNKQLRIRTLFIQCSLLRVIIAFFNGNDWFSVESTKKHFYWQNSEMSQKENLKT